MGVPGRTVRPCAAAGRTVGRWAAVLFPRCRATVGMACYNSLHTAGAASTANEIATAAAYVAETFIGAETATALVVTVV